MKAKAQQDKIEKQRTLNDPKKKLINGMLKEFFHDKEEEIKAQQDERIKEIK